ncbi:MAG: hypothetical protein WCK09_09730 [Bacteroidota bacterium]
MPELLYDLKELRAIAPDDESFVKEMIALFVSQNETTLQEIEVYTESRDYAKIKAILHKMKAPVMVMGVTQVSEIILQVEKMELSAMNEPVFLDFILKLSNILLAVNDQLRSI